MGRHQIYKGEPSTKNYYLINDFSGGMNTVDVDDVVKDNEFRELINVELSTKGLLQNRKGFGELVNFNNIIKNKLETFPQGTCYLFKVFKDDNRLLEVFDKFSEEDFETHIIHNKYDLRILLVIERTVYYLTINKEIGEDDFNVNLETKHTFPEFTTQKKALTNINTVDYLDKIYFSLSDISSELAGIGVFDTEKEEFEIIDNENCYKPTPYEVTNHEGLTGFNVLAQEPLTHIKIEDTGLKSILGVFITDANTGITLEKIPPNGNFDLKVIYTGTNFDPYEIGLTFTNQNGDNLNYILGDLVSLVGISIDEGYFTFHVRNLDLTNSNWVEINLEKKENIINVLDETHLVNDFLGIIPDTEGIYLEEDESLYIKTWRGFFKEDFTPFKPKKTLHDVEVIEGDIEDEFVRLISINDFLTNFPNQFEGYVRLFNSNLSYIYSVTKDERKDLLFKAYHFETWKDVLPTPTTTVVFVESTQTYHTLYWNSHAPAGWEWHFRKLNSYNENEIYNPLLGQHYEIGESANKEQIKGIDLTDVNIIEIDDRLVYYKGNTIWFSELGQFDYLPNRNYVMLPLKFDDEITNIHYFRGSYIVFTKQKIFKMSGKFETQDFGIEVLNEFVGCIAPKSVRSISNYLYFMSREGLYRLYNNAYSDGMENVKKVDELVHGYIKPDSELDSLLYNGQYMLFYRDNTTYDVLKYYYNINLPKNLHPITFDKYVLKPNVIFDYGVNVYALRNGYVYKYDKGYLDFAPPMTFEEDKDKYTYTTKIVTSNTSFNYPTHEKKIKEIYIKLYTNEVSLLYFSVILDGRVVIDPKTYTVRVNDEGELEYVLSVNPETLGNFEIGDDKLGGSTQQIHKVVVGGKGKNITLSIEQKARNMFGLVSIGYLYKLGKVREG